MNADALFDYLDMPIGERFRLIAYAKEAKMSVAECVRACTMTAVDAAISTARQTRESCSVAWTERGR